MRKGSVIAFPKWVSFNEEIAHLHAPTNIPQLLESIDCPIKKDPTTKTGVRLYIETMFWILFQAVYVMPTSIGGSRPNQMNVAFIWFPILMNVYQMLR
jgi:hypothetical protein